MIIEPRVDYTDQRTKALRGIHKRAKERPIQVPQARNRLSVPKGAVPEGWQVVWPTEDRLDYILEIGGKLVEPTDENCERYGIRGESGVWRSAFNQQPIGLKKGEHILCIVPRDVMDAIDDAIVLETAHMEVNSTKDISVGDDAIPTMGVDAFTRSAAAAAMRDHPGRIDGLSERLIKAGKEKVAGIKGMVDDKNDEVEEHKQARSRRGKAPRSTRSLNDVAEAKGLSRADIVPETF